MCMIFAGTANFFLTNKLGFMSILTDHRLTLLDLLHTQARMKFIKSIGYE